MDGCRLNRAGLSRFSIFNLKFFFEVKITQLVLRESSHVHLFNEPFFPFHYFFVALKTINPFITLYFFNFCKNICIAMLGLWKNKKTFSSSFSIFFLFAPIFCDFQPRECATYIIFLYFEILRSFGCKEKILLEIYLNSLAAQTDKFL